MSIQAQHKRLIGQFHELIRMLSLMLRNSDSYPLAVALDMAAEIQETSSELPNLSAAKVNLNSALLAVLVFWEE
jgi:hypothetical protein